MTGANKVSLANCSQCHNRAEVRVYRGFNPDPVCENCQEQNLKLENKIESKGSSKEVPTVGSRGLRQENQDLPERDSYVKTIIDNATPEWIENFCKETIESKILTYDWDLFLSNERYFSLLELKRLATDIPKKEQVDAKGRKSRSDRGKSRKSRGTTGRESGATGVPGGTGTRGESRVARNGATSEGGEI